MIFAEKRGLSGFQIAVFSLLLLLGLGTPQRGLAQAIGAPQNVDEEIIYIDGDGRIRVIDTNLTGPALIDWVSPDTGYIDFAVGDFNADGDYEVVGIKGDAGGRALVVFDPVIVPGSMVGAGTTQNGVQWIELYRTTLGARPTLIEAGDFDLDIPGDEIVYGMETGYRRSEIAILGRDMSLPAESADAEGRSWTHLVSTAPNGNFPRSWQYITVGQIDEIGTDEIVLVDGTREDTDDGFRSKIAAFRVDDGGLAIMTPFFERENRKTSWRYAEIAEMNGRSGAEIMASRSTANLLPNLFLFEYDMQRRTIRDLGDGCPDEPHESLTCPDDVMSLRLSPSPRWTFAADVTGDGQDEAFFLRNVTNAQNPVRLFGLDFMEQFTYNITPNFTATFTIDNVTTVYTQTNFILPIPVNYTGQIAFSDGRMIARDETTTHWATYYDVAKLDDYPATGQGVDVYNLWQRGAGGDTDGNGVDEVVVMRTDNIRTYTFRPDESNKWVALRNDAVATNNHSIKLANLDRNNTLRFANELAAENTTFTFVSHLCTAATVANQPIVPIEITINAAPPADFQAFATSAVQGQAHANTSTTRAATMRTASRPLQSTAQIVEWPSAAPWLKLSSGSQAPTTLSLEVVPTGIPQNNTYQKAQVTILPFGLGSDFQRRFTVDFLCASSQLFLPIVYDQN